MTTLEIGGCELGWERNLHQPLYITTTALKNVQKMAVRTNESSSFFFLFLDIYLVN